MFAPCGRGVVQRGRGYAAGNTFPNLRTMLGRVALCGSNISSISKYKYNGLHCSTESVTDLRKVDQGTVGGKRIEVG